LGINESLGQSGSVKTVLIRKLEIGSENARFSVPVILLTLTKSKREGRYSEQRELVSLPLFEVKLRDVKRDVSMNIEISTNFDGGGCGPVGTLIGVGWCVREGSVCL